MTFPLSSPKIILILVACVVSLAVYVFVTDNVSVSYSSVISPQRDVKVDKAKRAMERPDKRSGNKRESARIPYSGQDNNLRDINDNLKLENKKLKDEIKSLKQKLRHIEKNVSNMQECNKTPAIFNRTIPTKRRIVRGDINLELSLKKFEQSVTIIIYNNLSEKCLVEQLNNIIKFTPRIKVIVSTYFDTKLLSSKYREFVFYRLGKSRKEGFALNTMMNMITTEYFLYLTEGTTLYKYKSDNSPGWLLHAFTQVPELDFIGVGIIWDNNSTSRYAHFEIQCHRLKACYWTFEQTYEYKYSIGDMMVCDETSRSFMGRTTKAINLGPFDDKLDAMVTTDFFYRVKDKAVVGLMPEVFMYVGKQCFAKPRTENELSLLKQSFMDKYDLWQIKDSFGVVTKYPTFPKTLASKSIFTKMDYRFQGGFGPPYIKEDLQFFLVFMDNFFNQKNITYMILAGVSLGGIKTRDVLPWDTGDVDTCFFGVSWKVVYKDLNNYARENGVKMNFTLMKNDDSFPPGIPFIRARLSAKRLSHNDIYSREKARTPRPEQLMTIHINGRLIPVSRGLFVHFRKIYGINYLQMQGKKGNLRCTVKGHHACVPQEFYEGGGHWSDFYCRSKI